MGGSNKRSDLHKSVKNNLSVLKEFRKEMASGLEKLFKFYINGHTTDDFINSHYLPFLTHLERLHTFYNAMLLTKKTGVFLKEEQRQETFEKCQEIIRMDFSSPEMKIMQGYIELMSSKESIRRNPEELERLKTKFKELMPEIKSFDYQKARGVFLGHFFEEIFPYTSQQFSEVMKLAYCELIAIYGTPILYHHSSTDFTAPSLQLQSDLEVSFVELENYIKLFCEAFNNAVKQDKKKSVMQELKEHFENINTSLKEVNKRYKTAHDYFSKNFQSYSEFYQTCRHKVLSLRTDTDSIMSISLIIRNFADAEFLDKYLFANIISAKAKALHDKFIKPIQGSTHYALFFAHDSTIMQYFDKLKNFPEKVQAILDKYADEDTLTNERCAALLGELKTIYKDFLNTASTCLNKLKKAVIAKKTDAEKAKVKKTDTISLLQQIRSFKLELALTASREMRENFASDRMLIEHAASYDNACDEIQSLYKDFLQFINEHFTKEELLELHRQQTESTETYEVLSEELGSNPSSESDVTNTDSSSGSDNEPDPVSKKAIPRHMRTAAETAFDYPAGTRLSAPSLSSVRQERLGMWPSATTLAEEDKKAKKQKRPKSGWQPSGQPAQSSPIANGM